MIRSLKRALSGNTRWILILGSLALMALLGCSSRASTLTIASDLSNRPFAYVDGSEPTGFESDLLRAIADEMGEVLEWRRLEFSELLDAVAAESVDLACATIGVTPEREAIVDFSHPYYRTEIAVVVRVGDGEPTRVADLVGRRVSAAAGTTSERAVTQLLRGSEGVYENKTGSSARDRLASGEVDAAVMDGPDAIRMVVASNGALTRLPGGLTQELYAAAFSKARTDLRDRFNDALTRLRDRGVVAALLRRYEIPDEGSASD